MKHSPIGLLFVGFLSVHSCTQTEPVHLQVNAAKDTTWVYPAHLNPLMTGQQIVVTIESNLNSDGYLLIETESTRAIYGNGNRKETTVKSTSKRMIPRGRAKTYFTENSTGPTRYSYKSCGTNVGQLNIVLDELNTAKGEPKGFTVLPLTTNKNVTINRVQTIH